MAEENLTNREPAVSRHVTTIGEQKKWQQAAETPARSTRVTGGELLDDAKGRLRTLKQDTDDYVRKNPAKVVFTALGIGFVLGLMRRR